MEVLFVLLQFTKDLNFAGFSKSVFVMEYEDEKLAL